MFFRKGDSMNLVERMETAVGRLLVAVEMKAAQIDEMAEVIAKGEIRIKELEARLAEFGYKPAEAEKAKGIEEVAGNALSSVDEEAKPLLKKVE